MVNGATHPWILTGPWYRWASPYDPNSGRQERPVFQKFDSSDFVNGFLKDPQHSLKFLPPDDVVRRVGTSGMFMPRSGPSDRIDDNDTLKLYLDIHKRFYLVVCELHCDAAGFPSVGRDQVCEAGFVIRRRIPQIPQGIAGELRDRLSELGRGKARLAELETVSGVKFQATLGLRAQLLEKQASLSAELKAFTEETGIGLVLEGWIPDTAQHVGAWQPVDEEPQTIAEEILPLYPLVPDPRIRSFSGGTRTIYFGVVPTHSADVDLSGNARLDENTLYEVRCYVRRHKPGCPKKLGRADCHGELVWSRRTRSYQLANPFDLSGTGNRPVNIFLPSLPALEAQSKELKPGQGAPVRMISPPKSNIEFSMNAPDISSMAPKPPGAAICSFSIPLITIVAKFVFNIFLPILTFIFGLWFLLKLKFCIPPSLDLGAGLAADLDVALGKIDIGVSVDVAVSDSLFGSLKVVPDPSTGTTLASLLDSAGNPFDKGALASFAGSESADFSADLPPDITVDAPPPGAIKRHLPSATAGLYYEDPVEVRS